MLLKLFIGLSLIGVLSAMRLDCRTCEDRKPTGSCQFVEVTPCTGTPCILKRGSNVTISVSFTAGASSRKLTAEVYGRVKSMPVKFPLPNPDGCSNSGITCPIQAGQTYTYTDVLYVREIYPPVSVVVEWGLKSDDDKYAFCVVIPSRLS